MAGVTGCGKPYNKKQWMHKDGHYYLRESMVRDVMKNWLRKGMTCGEVVELLGETNYESPADSILLVYEIAVDYVFYDIDPKSGKDLYVCFTPDSLVSHFYLKEWEAGKEQ
jgi:hypothetical protein